MEVAIQFLQLLILENIVCKNSLIHVLEIVIKIIDDVFCENSIQTFNCQTKKFKLIILDFLFLIINLSEPLTVKKNEK